MTKVPQSELQPGIQPTLAAYNLTKIYHSGEVQVQALRGGNFELYPK
jgi:hypothetical protein